VPNLLVSGVHLPNISPEQEMAQAQQQPQQPQQQPQQLSAFVAALGAQIALHGSSLPPLEHVLRSGAAAAAPGAWAAEFGVFGGRTLRLIRAALPPAVPVLGFDCFTGLPDAWRDGFPKGAFDHRGRVPDIDDNTTVVKGLFETSLAPLLALFGDKQAKLIHIDCDIYSAARTALFALRGNIRDGTLLVFDELVGYPGFEQHEIRALLEFLADTGLGVQVVAAQGEQVALRVTDAKFAGARA
jgi:hypothetical protein